MQMTMTFAFADPGEAGIFFAEMAKVLSNTGSALSALFRQSAPPTTTPPAATSVPSVKPAADPAPESAATDSSQEDQAQVADAAPVEQKARRRRKTSEAHEVSSAVASGGKEPAAESSGASDVKDVKKAEAPSGSSVTVDQIRKAVNAVATDPSAGGAAAVMKVLSKYGAARIPDIKEGDLRKVAEDLASLSEKAKLVLLDEIPF